MMTWQVLVRVAIAVLAAGAAFASSLWRWNESLDGDPTLGLLVSTAMAAAIAVLVLRKLAREDWPRAHSRR